MRKICGVAQHPCEVKESGSFVCRQLNIWCLKHCAGCCFVAGLWTSSTWSLLASVPAEISRDAATNEALSERSTSAARYPKKDSTPLDYYLNRCRARTAAWLGCLDHLIIVKRRRSVWKYLATFSWCSDLQQHVVSWKLPTANITSTCKDNMEHSSPRKSKLHIFPLLLLLFIQID